MTDLEPATAKQVPVRCGSALHRQAALRAALEGISLNQWVVQIIAERVGAMEAADRILLMSTADNDPRFWTKWSVEE